MSTDIDGFPPSVDPGARDRGDAEDEDAAGARGRTVIGAPEGPEDSGALWVQREMRRRMEANARSGRGRHARDEADTDQLPVGRFLGAGALPGTEAQGGYFDSSAYPDYDDEPEGELPGAGPDAAAFERVLGPASVPMRQVERSGIRPVEALGRLSHPDAERADWPGHGAYLEQGPGPEAAGAGPGAGRTTAPAQDPARNPTQDHAPGSVQDSGPYPRPERGYSGASSGSYVRPYADPGIHRSDSVPRDPAPYRSDSVPRSPAERWTDGPATGPGAPVVDRTVWPTAPSDTPTGPASWERIRPPAADLDPDRTDVGLLDPVPAHPGAPGEQLPSDDRSTTAVPLVGSTAVADGDTGEQTIGPPRGARFPLPDEPDDGSPRRVRVVLSERKGIARTVRTVVDVQEGTPVGALLLRNLIRGQLGVALRVGVVAVLVLGALPVAFAVYPALGRFEVLGLRLPWIVLGLLVYPFLLWLGWWHTRGAEKIEQNFAEHVQD